MTTQDPSAGSQPPRPRTDAFLRGLARLVLSVFFRDVVVIGADRFPADGPVIVVSNHLNSLIDGVALTAALPRMPRMLAASIIWDNAPLRPLLAAAGVIPLYRLQDVGAGNTRHRDTFEQTWELLAGGGVLSLFPEGASHNEPHLLPMKSGAARIALETGKQRGPLDIRIVPVGLFYEAKTVFRSRALVEIGDPLDIGPDLDRYRNGDAAARQQSVRQLTARVDAALASVTLNFDTWNDARLVGRAADLWVRQDNPAAGELHLGDSYEMRRAFARGYAWIKIHYPEKTASLHRTIVNYDSLLTATGIDDHHVTAPHDGAARPGQIARSLLVLLLASPLLILSIALNWLPVQISRVFARGKDPDKMATWAIFSSLILFPVAWLIEAGIAGVLCANAFGAPWGWASVFAVLAAAPLSGRAALTFHDTRRRLFSQARAWWLLRTRRNLGPLLAATRRIALRDLREIVDIYDTESG